MQPTLHVFRYLKSTLYKWNRHFQLFFPIIQFISFKQFKSYGLSSRSELGRKGLSKITSCPASSKTELSGFQLWGPRNQGILLGLCQGRFQSQERNESEMASVSAAQRLTFRPRNPNPISRMWFTQLCFCRLGEQGWGNCIFYPSRRALPFAFAPSTLQLIVLYKAYCSGTRLDGTLSLSL